jgi:uncharacterized protein (DUF433 family)
MMHPRISSDPEVMMGKPCIRGTRITVELILRKLSKAMTAAQIVESYPHISTDDIYAAQAFAADYMAGERIMAAE